METLLDIILHSNGLRTGFPVTIYNAPYMALVIEALEERGPRGLPAISVAHYSEETGDLMRDPEMCFELSFDDGPDLDPYLYCNDHLGCEQWSRFLTGTDYTFKRDVYREHVSYAKVWDRNLHSRGFGKAFHQQRKQAA